MISAIPSQRGRRQDEGLGRETCARDERTRGGIPYVVARGFGPHRVFGGQGDAAHGDDQQDAHLEVTQGADVVTRPAEPGCVVEHF